ncbi:MAG: trehalose-phosphatase, partial [Chloroflexota bacterium]
VVAVVSGRRAEDVAQRVGVAGVTYVGNHGLEWHRDGVTEIFASPPAAQVQLAFARDALRLLLSQTPGFRLEEKGLAVALHYRRAQRTDRARDLALELAGRFAGDQLSMLEGRRVVELRIASRWNKGTVMQALATRHDLRGLVYLGDDVTDADAFRALADLRQAGPTRTLSVAVTNPETLIAALDAADVELDGPPAVGRLLYQLSLGFTPRKA